MLVVLLLFPVVILIFLFFILNRNKTEANQSTEKKLSKIDKCGIVNLIFLFLILIIDFADLFNSNFIYENFRELFFLINTVEFFSWILLIPGFFIFMIVNLIISNKKKKGMSVLTLISLLSNLIVGYITLAVYAGKF